MMMSGPAWSNACKALFTINFMSLAESVKSNGNKYVFFCFSLLVLMHSFSIDYK